MIDNISQKRGSHVCFLLGILVYVFMSASYMLECYLGDRIMMVLIFIMSGLFLIDAIDSVKLEFAGAAGIKKGIIAFICCGVQTVFARSVAIDLFLPPDMAKDVVERFIGDKLLLFWYITDDNTVFFFDLVIAVLVVITLAVIILPIIGIARKARRPASV